MFKNGTKMVNLEAYGTSENVPNSDSSQMYEIGTLPFQTVGTNTKGLVVSKAQLSENRTDREWDAILSCFWTFRFWTFTVLEIV